MPPKHSSRVTIRPQNLKKPYANTYDKFIRLLRTGKHTKADELLAEYDINHPFDYPIYDLEFPAVGRTTFLLLSIKLDHEDAVKKIASMKEVDLNYKLPTRNQTVFNMVSECRDCAMAKILLDNGVQIDLSNEKELCMIFVLIGENDFDEEYLRKIFTGAVKYRIDSDEKWGKLIINVVLKGKNKAFDIILEGIEEIRITESMARYVGSINDSYYLYEILNLVDYSDVKTVSELMLSLMNYVEMTIEQLTADKIKAVSAAHEDTREEMAKTLQVFKSESYAVLNLKETLSYIKNKILSEGHRYFPVFVANLIKCDSPILQLTVLLEVSSDEDVIIALRLIISHQQLHLMIQEGHTHNLIEFFHRLAKVTQPDAEIKENMLGALSCTNREDLERQIAILRPADLEVNGVIVNFCYPQEQLQLPDIDVLPPSPVHSPVFSVQPVDLNPELSTVSIKQLRIDAAVKTLRDLLSELPMDDTVHTSLNTNQTSDLKDEQTTEQPCEPKEKKEQKNYEIVKETLRRDYNISEYPHVMYRRLVSEIVGTLAGACKDFFAQYVDSIDLKRIQPSAITSGKRLSNKLKAVLEWFYVCKTYLERSRSAISLNVDSRFGAFGFFMAEQRRRVGNFRSYLEAITGGYRLELEVLIDKLKNKLHNTQFSVGQTTASSDHQTNVTTLTTPDEAIALGKQMSIIQKKFDQFFPGHKIQAGNFQFHFDLDFLFANFGSGCVEKKNGSLGKLEALIRLSGSFDTDLLRVIDGLPQVVEQKESVPKGETYEETIWEEGIKFLKARFVLLHALILAQEFCDYSLLQCIQVKSRKHLFEFSIEEKCNLFEIFTSIEMWRIRFGKPSSDPKKAYRNKDGVVCDVPAPYWEKINMYLELLNMLSKDLFNYSPVDFSRAIDRDVGCDDVVKAVTEAQKRLAIETIGASAAAQSTLDSTAGPAGVIRITSDRRRPHVALRLGCPDSNTLGAELSKSKRTPG